MFGLGALRVIAMRDLKKNHQRQPSPQTLHTPSPRPPPENRDMSDSGPRGVERVVGSGLCPFHVVSKTGIVFGPLEHQNVWIGRAQGAR